MDIKPKKLALNQETLRHLNADPDHRKIRFGSYVNCATNYVSCPECNPPGPLN